MPASDFRAGHTTRITALNEVFMQISKQDYARRRKALMNQMEPNSIAILPAALVYVRNRDVEHNYRQDSDFQPCRTGRCGQRIRCQRCLPDY